MERILLVDDEKEILEVIKNHLTAKGYVVSSCNSGEEALEFLQRETFSLVITDLKMAGLNGIELCDRIAGNQPDLPVLILTAFGTLDIAVEAIRAGAYDFLVKPLNFEALTETVAKAIRNYNARKQVQQLETLQKKAPETLDEGIIGESKWITELRALVHQISDLETTVLVTGESGTGKELISKSLHRQSRKASLPFVVVNCATIPEAVFEQELFGKIDAAKAKNRVESTGLAGSAQGGTLFFDEISHLPLTLQPKLLRLLEERLYKPIGGVDELHCSSRFVIATNEDLDHAVRTGTFRQDLFFRINVMHLKLLPLRERGNDILILAHHFLKLYASRMGKGVKSLSEPVTEKLMNYKWPGNVRELRNAIERAVGVTKYDHIVVQDLPDHIQQYKVAEIFKGNSQEQMISVDQMEEKHILGVLKELKGNKALAAKVLKMDRKTLYRKLERYGYKDLS